VSPFFYFLTKLKLDTLESSGLVALVGHELFPRAHKPALANAGRPPVKICVVHLSPAKFPPKNVVAMLSAISLTLEARRHGAKCSRPFDMATRTVSGIAGKGGRHQETGSAAP